MAEIWTMGEMIVEIMREKENEPLDKAGVFRGPYPSGAPAIFIDTVARLGGASRSFRIWQEPCRRRQYAGPGGKALRRNDYLEMFCVQLSAGLAGPQDGPGACRI